MNAQKLKQQKPLVWRIFNLVDYIVFSLVVIVVLLLCGITFWLNPRRLSEIIDEKASKELNADVSTSSVSFTFWSTFPHFCIVADSLHVRSRDLDNLPDSIRKSLPANPDFLLSASKVKGGINIAKLLKGEIWLRDVDVKGLNLNLVAVNDSLNNYTLLPPSAQKTHVPYFNIDCLEFTEGGQINYFSLLSNTKAHVSLSDASLMPQRQKNDYHLRFRGSLDAMSDGFNMLSDFPFELDGNIQFRFKPFGVSANDYAVNLGKIKGRMGMDLNMGDNTELRRFDYHLSNFSLNDLQMLLPTNAKTVLRRLHADLDIEAGARLTSPYDFSSGYFPSLEIDVKVPDGKLGYAFSDNEYYTVDKVELLGRFIFNGQHPDSSYIDIPSLRLKGLGADVTASGRITNLTQNPHISVKMGGTSDLDEASRRVAALNSYKLSGIARLGIGLIFDVIDSHIANPDLRVSVKSDRLGISIGGYDISVTDLESSSEEKYPAVLTRSSTASEIPLHLNLKARNAVVSDKNDSVAFKADELRASADLSRRLDGNIARNFNLSLAGADLKMKTRGFGAVLGGADIEFEASYLDRRIADADYQMPERWTEDKETMDRVGHSPEFVQFHVSDNLKRMIDRWKVKASLKSKTGKLNIDGYDLDADSLDIAASLDSINLNHISLAHGNTRGAMKADITNLRQFLTSTTPAPIFINADVSLDTVQINQLAYDFAMSHPDSPVSRGDKKEMGAGIDTLSILIPRNIMANVHATAMQTRYTNLHLYDLMTNVRVANGVANIDTLHITSDFGQATLNMLYDTSNLQDLKAAFGLKLSDVDVVSFFRNFNKLLVMWPEMKNLSGTINISLDGRVHVFPNMYINAPSLWANAVIEGKELKLHQNAFIRHLAHMLLINQEGPIDIKDIELHAAIHSNLLELFPTTFEVSKYKLEMMGLNNFNGDMFYHVGVEDWPLKIPFGVNIKGHYHHPVMRFGSKNWHDKNGAIITGGVQDTQSFNLVNASKHYGGEFIHSAAAYKGD